MKHIFVGIDGTSNSAFYDKFKTNIHRMNLSLDHRDKRGRPQLFIYSAGVGASYNELFALMGKAFGQGIDEIILEAYVNLVSNYEPGDKIYIFGFSRGAIAARALSGLISKSGLLKAEYSVMIEEAWKYFVGEKSEIAYRSLKGRMTHKDARIRFLGVWDTVYGRVEQPPEKDRFTRLRLRTLELDKSVSVGVHVLSIDDRRQYFHPFLWDKKSRHGQHMEQIWMPGVHSDVGGGYEQDFLSTLSLLTMIDKLHQYCPDVRFDAAYLREFVFRPLLEEPIVVHNEREGYEVVTDLDRERAIDANAIAMNQVLHPILAFMGKSKIEIRGNEEEYNFDSVRRGGDFSLPLAAFGKKSVYAVLEKALERRLKPKVVKPKRPKRALQALPATGATRIRKPASTYAIFFRYIRLRFRRSRPPQQLEPSAMPAELPVTHSSA